MAAISRARGRTMRDIVSTIQAEQDEAIRAPYQGVTIISGGPGTGKTVVALHRAAYLLYSNRARLEKGGVLVVGPSAVFMNYIERVLPSLGEDSVVLRAIGSVAVDVLGMTSERIDAAAAASLKGSLTMLPILQRLVRLPLTNNPDALQLRVTIKGEVLSLGSQELDRIRNQILASNKLNRSKSAALENLVSALLNNLPSDVEISPDQAEQLVRDHPALTMFLNSWWPLLTPTKVLARLSEVTVASQVAPELSGTELASLVSSYNWLQLEDANAEIHGWSVADIALLDELAHLLGPMPEEEAEESIFLDLDSEEVTELVTTADKLTQQRDPHPPEEPQDTFAHILVDEGQDVTPMQWRMLRRRGPQSSWTIVGDPAQSSYPNRPEVEQALTELVGRSPRRQFRMSTNYRSPKEVFEVAQRVITAVDPEADLPTAVRSTGVAPKLVQAAPSEAAGAILEETLELAGQVSGTIGLIVPPSRSNMVQRLVMSQPRLTGLEERLVVVSPLQAKGLEYDGVLVVAPDEIVAQAPSGERVLYVALTRATQRMTVLDFTDSAPSWRAALG